jgi:hypothetical protein
VSRGKPHTLRKTFFFLQGYISYLQLKYFQNSKKFVVGQDVEVMVTHVRDPFYICVQLVSFFCTIFFVCIFNDKILGGKFKIHPEDEERVDEILR